MDVVGWCVVDLVVEMDCVYWFGVIGNVQVEFQVFFFQYLLVCYLEVVVEQWFGEFLFLGVGQVQGFGVVEIQFVVIEFVVVQQLLLQCCWVYVGFDYGNEGLLEVGQLCVWQVQFCGYCMVIEFVDQVWMGGIDQCQCVMDVEVGN